VKAAAFTTAMPLSGDNWGKSVTFYDRPLPSNVRDLPSFEYRVVAGDFFRALGVPIRKGRAFDDRDVLGNQDVAIVSEEFARRYWGNSDPLGKVISVNPPAQLVPAGTLPPGYQGPEKFTVVGVAADVRYAGLHQPQGPVVYVPYSQGAEGTTTVFLLVRTEGDPLSLAAAVRERIWDVDKDQPVTGIGTLEETISASVAQPRFQTGLLALFAALATVLAAVGIHGVMSYSVAQRSHEIGVRRALGAQPGDVLQLVVGHGFWLTVAGVGIGVVASVALTRLFRTILFQVSPMDPSTYASGAVLLVVVGLAACYVPARRAMRVDPMTALRYE
jgi:putative ABC transport system permease protein